MIVLKGMILVIGQHGQVARALKKLAPSQVHCLSRQECDLANPDQLETILKPLLGSGKVKCLINAAAYTQVDQAEADQQRCLDINGNSPGILAKLCERIDIPFIHYSSDYVYGSNGDELLTETSPCQPLNFYAQTKLKGDQDIQKTKAKAFILRTSWVYDEQGKNFFTTMLNLFKSKTALNVVSDQIGSPTYATDIADITLKLIDSASNLSRPEVLHLTNQGLMSWYDFASKILKLAKEQNLPTVTDSIHPIPSSQYPLPAKRQLNSRLSLDKLITKYEITPRSVDDALKSCMEAYCSKN